MAESTSDSTRNGLKLLGESLLPGASLLMEGRIVAGGAHTVVGTLARLMLGPFGVALVAANAYSSSVTGKGLLAQLAQLRPKKPATTAATEAAALAAARAAAEAATRAAEDATRTAEAATRAAEAAARAAAEAAAQAAAEAAAQAAAEAAAQAAARAAAEAATRAAAEAAAQAAARASEEAAQAAARAAAQVAARRVVAPTALDLDGVDDHVVFPAMTLDFARGFTVEAWVWFDAFPYWSRIIDLSNGAGSDNIVFAHHESTRKLSLYIFQGGALKALDTDGDVLETGRWMHVAGTVDPAGNGTLFVDGVAVKSGPSQLPRPIERRSNFLGKSVWNGGSLHDGKFDELRIWTIARPREAIRADMHRRLTGREDELAVYYRFHGKKAVDHSAHFADGTIHGAVQTDGPPMEPPLRNLALGRPASQSSIAYQGDPARAVDGKIDGNWPAGGVTHTACDAQAWWLVDLGAVYDIKRVVLHNRTDSCGERLTDFFVRLSEDERDWHSIHHPGTAAARVAFPVDRPARYVKVQLAGSNWLSLAEVEVFGADARD